MKINKNSSLIIKILVVVFLASLILFSFLWYIEKSKEEEISRKYSQLEEKPTIGDTYINSEDLIQEYQENILELLENFDGNFIALHQNLMNLIVPNGFQNLHLNLVIALDSVVYSNNRDLAEIRLKEISQNNSWLNPGLNKLISYLD